MGNSHIFCACAIRLLLMKWERLRIELWNCGIWWIIWLSMAPAVRRYVSNYVLFVRPLKVADRGSYKYFCKALACSGCWILIFRYRTVLIIWLSLKVQKLILIVIYHRWNDHSGDFIFVVCFCVFVFVFPHLYNDGGIVHSHELELAARFEKLPTSKFCGIYSDIG